MSNVPFQNFTPAEELIEEREREQFILERQAWEQQCGQLHGEVAKLTDMCNNLLRDQQTLVSALIGRNNLPGPPMSPLPTPNGMYGRLLLWLFFHTVKPLCGYLIMGVQ